MSSAPVSKSLLCASLAINALIIFSLSVTNMASLYIMGTLGGSKEIASYTTSFFAIGNTLTIPLGLQFARRKGMKGALKITLFSLIILSFMIPYVPNYPLFLLLRFLQGVSAGPLLVLVPAVLSTLSEEEGRNFFIRNTTVMYVSTSIVAAALGGSIAYEWSWRDIFHVESVITIVLTIYFLHEIKKIEFPSPSRQFDLWGYFLFFIGLLSMSLFLILGQQLDWFRSPFLSFLFPLGIVFLAFFLFHSYHHPSPIINLPLLFKREILFVVIQTACLFSAYFGTVFLLSIWLNLYVQYTPNWITLVLGIMAVTAIGVMLFMHKLQEHHLLPTLMVAVLFLAYSCYLTMNYDVEVDFKRLAFARIISGVGLALFYPPLFHLMLNGCGALQGMEGLTLFQMTRTLSSGLGIAFYATLWQRREIFFYERLGETLTNISNTTGEFFTHLKNYAIPRFARFVELETALDEQSQSLAINDVFYSMYYLMIALAVMIILFYVFVFRKSRGVEKHQEASKSHA